MKKTALSLTMSLLLLTGSPIVLANQVENVGFSQNESQLKLKKHLNLKKLKLTADKLKKFGKEELAKLEPKVLSFFDENNIKDIPSDAFLGISLAQFSQLDADGLKGLTIAQFDKIPSGVLKALKAENLGDLSEVVISEFSLEDVLALEDGQLKTATGKDLVRLLVNVGKKHIGKGINQKVKPSDLKRFLPVGWSINEAGELNIPEGESLALPAVLTPINLLNNVVLPKIPNLGKGFGLYGAGNPFLLGMNAALKTANLGQYNIEQDADGILQVKDNSGDSDFTLAFMPDKNNMKQAKKGKKAGLSTDKRGFFVLTTDDGRDIPILPAPKDLKKILGLEKVELGEAGDVLMKLAAGKHIFGVGLFDPFLTAAANGLSAGVHFDENDIKGTKPAKVVYEDGSSQLMYPTVHKPADFFKAALKIAGVEAVQMNADGTLAVLFEGKKFQLEPSFNVKESPLPKDEDSVEPKIEINPDGTIDYTIQNEQALLTIPLNIIAK